MLPCNNSIEQSLFPLGSGATCVLHTMTGRMLVAACQTFVDTKSVDLHKMDRKWQQPEVGMYLLACIGRANSLIKVGH